MSSAANSFIRVGGPARGQPILEREHEKLVLAQGVEQARHGNGSVILVEAPAGKGKSALLAIAADLATRAGLRVAAARATELEREFPFGVVIQLFEPHWMSAGAKEREHLVGGPARWAGELLDAGLRAMGSTSGEHAFAMIHSLFWFAWNLARPSWQGSVTRPMAIVVDDLHLADAPSLRFLSYLAARVADMPILLVTAGREGSSPSDPTALAALREAEDDIKHGRVRPIEEVRRMLPKWISKSSLPKARRKT